MSTNCKYIRAELENGEVLEASGEHAKEVWDWIRWCELMTYAHGIVYRGKPLTIAKNVSNGVKVHPVENIE